MEEDVKFHKTRFSFESFLVLMRREGHTSPPVKHLPRLKPCEATHSSPRASPRLDVPEARLFKLTKDEDQKVVGGNSSNDSGNSGSDDSKIKEIETTNVRFLNFLPMVAFQSLTKMTIHWDDKVKSLSEVEGVFRSCSSSLRFLKVRRCKNLRSVSKGLEHLAALESLEVVDLPELSFHEMQGEGEEAKEDEDDATSNGMPWRCLAQCLRSLKLCCLPKVVELPKGMRYLTALQSLKINSLPLKDIPEWVGCLPSLHSLEIEECEGLKSLPEALEKLNSQIT